MSLGARIIAAICFVALVLAGVLVFVTRTTEDNLVAQVDEQLLEAANRVRDVGGRPPRGDDGTGSESPDWDDDAEGSLSSLWVGELSGDEVVTVLRPGLSDDDDDLPEIEEEQVLTSVGAPPFTVSSDDSGLRWRVYVYQEGPDGRVVAIALPLGDVDDSVADLVRLEVVGAAVILVALALVALWVIRLGVRPVKRMTGVATAIADGDLTQRVPETTAGTEAAELGAALNRMLASIEASFDERERAQQRLRQFVADASHELRTPVATIRGYAELYRVGGLAEQSMLDDAMRRTEQEAIRMGGLVEDLLALARLDQGRPLDLAPLDLAAVAADAAADARATAPQRTIRCDDAGPAQVVADDARVRQVVANLVGNALVHTPPEATITITTGCAADGTCHVEVADDGPGMSEEVAEHAFERFYRADPSRSRHQGGSGLGLAIVDAVVAAHGGTVSLDTAPGRGTVVRLTLPVSGPDPLEGDGPAVGGLEADGPQGGGPQGDGPERVESPDRPLAPGGPRS